MADEGLSGAIGAKKKSGWRAGTVESFTSHPTQHKSLVGDPGCAQDDNL